MSLVGSQQAAEVSGDGVGGLCYADAKVKVADRSTMRWSMEILECILHMSVFLVPCQPGIVFVPGNAGR